jgi:hypothetical protein
MVRLLLIGAFALLSLPASAWAQAPQTRPLTVSFTGVVTDDINNTIMIRQPDGTMARYAGPVPDYVYRRGDQVSVSFTTTVPTGAYYQANNVPLAADGIYRFRVTGPIGSPRDQFGVASNPDVSGPLSPATDFGIGGLTIVYDATADSYSLELPTGSWGNGYYRGPSYTYDPVSGALTPVPRNCFTALCEDGALVRGTATTATVTTAIGLSTEPSNIGFFTWVIDGMFNLPLFQSGGTGGGGGGPTPVPEPGTMLLFAAGAGWIALRQRRAVRAA